MTVAAVIVTLALWFVGLLIDANVFEMSLSVVLPVVGMGAFILEAIRRKKE